MGRLSLFSGSLDASRRYALVAVERGIERVGEDGAELLYEIPGAMEAEGALEVGERVEVPLGKKKVGGVVVGVGGTELLGDLDPLKVRVIAKRSGAMLPGPLVELAKWIAGYYVCPLGMVLGTMVPSAVKREIGRREEVVLVRSDVAAPEKMTAPVRALWEKVVALPAVPMTPIAMKIELGESTLRGINKLVKLGLLREEMREVIRSRGNAVQEQAFGGDKSVTLSDEQNAVVNGIVPELGPVGKFGVHLLYGVTGSGKTEVYLRLIRAMLAQRPDASAIVLVPEIALTPQASERFSQRFADLGVAVLHSGLSASRRHSEWARVASGEARVVVGARSAVFAPVPMLGLVVVDEEHDTSYKQDQLPRYHARDVAIKRAQIEGCAVVLGSATPSLESWANAGGERHSPQRHGGTEKSGEGEKSKDGGDAIHEHDHSVVGRETGRSKYRLWKLTKRVGGGELPRIKIVDMYQERQEARQLGLRDPSVLPTLRRALLATLKEGSQAILLLNRRGFATYVGCAGGATCGWVLGCERCDARMILHRDASLKSGELVRCHHCLSECVVPRVCPNCSRGLVRLGAGTQRVEEELQPLLEELSMGPEALIRVDRDTMRTARDYFEALATFASGRARLMLGTQMIAKGLDFPGVRLVGVVNADTGLNLPDFRAGERTFQLISQVSGRAGRADSRGAVIIQTMEPQNPAIVLASEHAFERFASTELAARRQFGLPPASRMARVVCRDEKQSAVRTRSVALAEWLRAWSSRHVGGGVKVRGPSEPPVTRIADQFRLGIELVAARAGLVQEALRAARNEGLVKSDAKTAVDVDPVSLM
ncbi:MAG: primosomal protein N' [Planctomycetes bacterium]|nr:primosomal protein N' [Planctomycetota bacterium]